jgi:hypothetical protein
VGRRWLAAVPDRVDPRVADIRKLEQAWPKLATITGDEW